MQLPAEDMEGVVKRLQRAQGQMGGIVRMIQEERDCQEVVTQLAAVSKAIDRAGFAIIAVGLKQRLASKQGAADTSDLERLFLALA